jgi:DNA repair exonuclease SbcCD ATPase subunit
MDYIQQLISFSEETQAQFYLILEEPEAIEEGENVPSPTSETSKSQDDGNDATSSNDVEGKDRELVYEERIAELVAVNKGLEHETIELREQLENMHDLHTKLQKSYDNLEIQQQDTAERLDALRSGKGEQSMIGIQRTKMQQQETVIATLESNIHSLQDENNGLKVQSELLQSQTEGFQKMQDDMYELKLDREQLQRRANAADKYKEKLQSLREVEAENEALKHRVTELQRQLKQSDSDEFKNSDLRRENDELRRLVSNIEQSLNDSNEAKKRAEIEKMTLEAKLRQADDQATKWHSRAEDLQVLLNEHQLSGSPTTPRPASKFLNLDASDDDGPLQDIDLNEQTSEMQLDDPNVISEEELQTIVTIMKAHAQSVSNAEKTSSIQEQQKLTAKIEKSRATTQALTQVIDYLALPRVEFIGVRDLDEGSPYKPVSPHIDDLASMYGVARQSARSSVTSLSHDSRRSSLASFHSTQSNFATPRPKSMLGRMFGTPDT